MSRIRNVFIALALVALSLPVFGAAVAECSPQVRSAPRACCGPNCSCPMAAACSCKSSPAPGGPVAPTGLPAAELGTNSDPTLHPSWVLHPATACAPTAPEATAPRSGLTSLPCTAGHPPRLMTLRI